MFDWRVCVSRICVYVQGFSDIVCERIPTWHFVTHPGQGFPTMLHIQPHCDMAPEHHPQALASALRQLTSLQIDPDLPIYMYEWVWSDAFVAALSAALTDVPHSPIGLKSEGTMGDESLALVLSLGPKIKHVWAERGMSLSTYDQALVAWPWESLASSFLTAGALLRLPVPGTVGAVRVVRAGLNLDLTYEQVSVIPSNAHA